jgi:hypothetical protein
MLSKKSARLELEKRRCFESILLLLCSRSARVSLLFDRRRIKERARAINERRSVLSLCVLFQTKRRIRIRRRSRGSLAREKNDEKSWITLLLLLLLTLFTLFLESRFSLNSLFKTLSKERENATNRLKWRDDREIKRTTQRSLLMNKYVYIHETC